MNSTHLQIRKIEDEQSAPLALFGVFTVGIISGVILGIGYDKHLLTPLLSAKSQSASIGNAVTENSSTTNITEAASTILPTAPLNSQVTLPASDAVATARTAEQSDLKLRIADRKLAIERLNEEMERTKNDSVAVIQAFNQNCGNWQDSCASGYSSKLDANNATYSGYTTTLASLQSDLLALEAQLAQLQ